MQFRAACSAEAALDLCDRACTLTFVISATVRGALTREALEGALRYAEGRHPMLRARIVRTGPAISGFEVGAASPVPLLVRELPHDELLPLLERQMCHRVWPDDGARAEVSWLRHGPGHATLMLTFHHVVCDGLAGMIVLSDILSALRGIDAEPVEVPSIAVNTLLPRWFGGPRHILRWFIRTLRLLLTKRPHLVQQVGSPAPEERRPRLHTIRLSERESSAIRRLARREGASVQGVLGAAMTLAIALVEGRKLKQRITHAVDLRGYLKSIASTPLPLSEMFGFCAGKVSTEHEVSPGDQLGKLAAQVTSQMRDRIARGDPVLSIPMAWEVKRLVTMELPKFRKMFAQSPLTTETVGITNLGEIGAYFPADLPLRVEEVNTAVAGTLANTLCLTVNTFRGSSSLYLVTVEPMVPYEYGVELARRAKEVLLAYAQASEAELPEETALAARSGGADRLGAGAV